MHAAPRLRIAMLAPPWIPVPPSGYGGIETVVAVLTDTLVERGHDVTLFAAPGSSCAGRTHAVLDRAIPDEIGAARHEVDHVTTAFDVIEGDRRAFDVIHDHSGHVALAMADRVSLPLVHTEHGPFDASARSFYGRHGHRADLQVLLAHRSVRRAERRLLRPGRRSGHHQ